MPTFNRRRFVPQAIKYFLRQDYESKELIIVDDGTDAVVDLVPADDRIRYIRLDKKLTIGAKRNLACGEAHGEIIAHWDDDDWVADWRLRYQVGCLQQEHADICGLNRVFFFDPVSDVAWEYVYSGGDRLWVYGATLCYTKSFWEKNSFPNIDVGEDARFVWSNPSAKKVALPDNRFLAALVHLGNTSPKRTGDSCWRKYPVAQIRELIGKDWDYYAGHAADGQREASASSSRSALVSSAYNNDQSVDALAEVQRPLQPLPRQSELVKVSVGIHVTEDGARLLASCSAIETNTGMPVELLLLADGADESAEAVMSKLTGFRRIGFATRRGAPACFNLLLSEAQGDILVFLESGALPGPGWLELLISALSNDSRNGLAGPSTNRSWNMQSVFPQAKGDDVAAITREAHRRFGNTVRTMEPLYCLADFCYVVRREVVKAIGGADEDYGEGPCWEMDYSVRAARAGWRPVWAQSAYVYRMPVTPERRQRDAVHFEASRRRYQDKFCALHLSGASTRYEAHCRGEHCKNFAPVGHIGIVIPLKHRSVPQSIHAPLVPQHATAFAPLHTPPSRPLVSCIMPTRNRRPFIELTLQCFDAQDYEPRELIIVDDGDDPIEDLVCGHPKVRYLRLKGHHSIGAKRNMACEAAQGEVVVHWDDDDWYGPHRITAQVEPILSGEGQFTGLDARWILSLDSHEFWTVSAELHRRMFVGDIHGGTLSYARVMWERGPRFPSINLAEDASFLSQAMRQGAHLIRVANEDLFVYMRHTGNAWKFEAGRFLSSQGWLHIDPPNGFANSLIQLYEQAMAGCHA